MTYQPTLKEIITFIDDNHLDTFGWSCRGYTCCNGCEEAQPLAVMVNTFSKQIKEHMTHSPVRLIMKDEKAMQWFIELGKILGIVTKADS